MPIIRIPTSGGGAPRAEDDAGFGFRRAQFEDRKKARIRDSIQQAVSNALKLGGAIAGDIKQKEARDKNELARKEIKGFQADAERLLFAARVNSEEQSQQFAFNPDGLTEDTNARNLALGEGMQSLADGLTTEEAREAALFFIEKNLPLEMDKLGIVSLESVKETERDLFEASVIERRDQARAIGDLTPLSEGLTLLDSGGGPLASFNLPEADAARLKSNYIYNPALSIVGDALSDPARREDMVRDVLAGNNDAVLGPMKWAAKEGAEKAGRELLSFYAITAEESVSVSPTDDPARAIRDLLSKAEEDEWIAERVLAPHELQGWRNQVDKLTEQLNFTDQANANAVSLLTGNVPPGYAPLSSLGRLSSSIAFEKMLSDSKFQNADIPDQAVMIANLVSLSRNTPQGLGAFIQQLTENIQKDDGTSAQMIAALGFAFHEAGVNLTDHGVMDAILGLEVDAPTSVDINVARGVGSNPGLGGRAGAAAYARRLQQLPPGIRERAERQLNQGDMLGFAAAVNLGRDRASLASLERQVQFTVSDTRNRMVQITEEELGAQEWQQLDFDTRGQFLTYGIITEALENILGKDMDALEARESFLERQLREMQPKRTREEMLARVEQIKAEPVPEDKLNPKLIREQGREAVELKARQRMIEDVMLGRDLLGQDMKGLIDLALSGNIGEEAKVIASELSSLRSAGAMGWDPSNSREYDRGWIQDVAMVVWDDVVSNYPASQQMGANLETAIINQVHSELASMAPTRFARGVLVENPPELSKPDIFMVWQNEFLPGGKLAGQSKDEIIDNLVGIVEAPDGRDGWFLIVTDELGRTTPLVETGTGEEYLLSTDDEEYLRMQSIAPPEALERLTVSIAEEAHRQILEKRADKKTQALWGDLGERGMREFWQEQEGLAFPLIGVDNLQLHLSAHANTPNPGLDSPYPGPDEWKGLNGAAPPISLLPGLRSSKEKLGFASINDEGAEKVAAWLRAYPLAIEAKRVKREQEIMARVEAGKLGRDEARFEVGKVNLAAQSLTGEIDEMNRQLKPMFEWYENAKPWGLTELEEGMSGAELFKKWRMMNLSGQYRAWRKWKGISGARFKPADLPRLLDNWIKTGGMEEWMSLPSEIRRNYE